MEYFTDPPSVILLHDRPVGTVQLCLARFFRRTSEASVTHTQRTAGYSSQSGRRPICVVMELGLLRTWVVNMQFSNELIREWGFRPFEANESISVSLESVRCYEIRGISPQSVALEVKAGTIDDTSYRIGFGADLNETTRAVADDDFYATEDEEAMKGERRASGPFLIMKIGPAAPFTIKEGYLKSEPDGSLRVFGSLSSGRTELTKLESIVLPTLITALTCELAQHVPHISIIELDHANLGRTGSGQIVRDFDVRMSMSGRVDYPISPSIVSDSLKAACELAPKLNRKAARFFALGTAEEDPLKRFLYWFLALEVETHSKYGTIDHAKGLRQFCACETQRLSAADELLQKVVAKLSNLSDRFVWCAACLWVGITDADVRMFKRLKKTRDRIAHGEIDVPPKGEALKLRELALKVFGPVR